MIFRWYSTDFGSTEVEKALWISQYLSKSHPLQTLLQDGNKPISIRYSDPNWDTNWMGFEMSPENDEIIDDLTAEKTNLLVSQDN